MNWNQMFLVCAATELSSVSWDFCFRFYFIFGIIQGFVKNGMIILVLCNSCTASTNEKKTVKIPFLL